LHPSQIKKRVTNPETSTFDLDSGLLMPFQSSSPAMTMGGATVPRASSYPGNIGHMGDAQRRQRASLVGGQDMEVGESTACSEFWDGSKSADASLSYEGRGSTLSCISDCSEASQLSGFQFDEDEARAALERLGPLPADWRLPGGWNGSLPAGVGYRRPSLTLSQQASQDGMRTSFSDGARGGAAGKLSIEEALAEHRNNIARGSIGSRSSLEQLGANRRGSAGSYYNEGNIGTMSQDLTNIMEEDDSEGSEEWDGQGGSKELKSDSSQTDDDNPLGKPRKPKQKSVDEKTRR